MSAASRATQGPAEPVHSPVAPGTPAPFRIATPALSRGTADRSEDLRDPDRILRAWERARVVLVDAEGRLAAIDVAGVPRLHFTPARALGERPPVGAVLLGSLDGVDHWALATAGGVESGTVPGEAGGPVPGGHFGRSGRCFRTPTPGSPPRRWRCWAGTRGEDSARAAGSRASRTCPDTVGPAPTATRSSRGPTRR